MSLSEQLERVDGAQKNTLKTILTKLGVSVGSQKIDQYPNLANGISAKLNPNNLVSASTASAYGLSSTATTDQVLAKARSLITTAQNTANSAGANANGRLKLISGSYVGTQSVGDNAGPGYPTVINMGVNPVAVFIASCKEQGYYFPGYTAIPWTQGSVGFTVESSPSFGFNVVTKTNPFTFYDGGRSASTATQLNLSDYTYYWAALYY